MIQKKVWFENSKNQKLCGIFYIPEGKGPFPVVIVCHGLASSKESRNTAMTYPDLAKNNIAEFAFDFSGHGESEGKFEDVTISQAVDDMKSAVDFVENQEFIDKNKIGVLGSSFGAITSMMAASEDKRIKSLVLKAPIIDFKFSYDINHNIKEWREKGYEIYESKIVKYPKLNYSYYLDGVKYNCIEVSKKIKIPTLIFVGDKDKTIFTEKVKGFFNSLKCEKELKIIKGAYHWFSDEDSRKIFSIAISWFVKHLK